MTEERKRSVPKRLVASFFKIVVVFFRALIRVALYLLEKAQKDFLVAWMNIKLFLGVAMICIGFLSFQSGRYCDGNASSQYVCTRPATYYYYPFWAVVLTVLGSMLVILWTLRRSRLR